MTLQDTGAPVQEVNWSALIPDEEWAVYERVIDLAEQRGLRFVLGGGLAFSYYSGRVRNTKDLDLFILPEQRDAFVEVTAEAGAVDYYEKLSYDRRWIYRAYQDDVIVDLIWSMANLRTAVDEAWLERGAAIDFRGRQVRLIPLEELIWAKLYVMQRERCDWPDLLNILYASGDRVEWDYLLDRIEPDAHLLGGLVSVFRWVCPERAAVVPSVALERMGLIPELPPETDTAHRTYCLDTRDWFGPKQEVE